MLSFSLAFIFLIELGLALALLWQYWWVRDHLKALELRQAEALDDQDLMEFQERVSALLSEVKQSGKDMASLIDSRRASLDKESSRAREAEKLLAERIKTYEKTEAKAHKRLAELAEDLSKKSAKGKGKAASRPARSKSEQDELSQRLRDALAEGPEGAEAAHAAADEKALKLSYLKREFRSPEPSAPVTPTATRYLKVYEMADDGSNREEIAKATGYLPGEVELILNLRPRKRG